MRIIPNLFGYSVDLIVLNRMIPEEVKDNYFFHWKALQEIYKKKVEECFSPLPIFSLDILNREATGINFLSAKKEILLALRSLIDTKIEIIEKREEEK